MRDTVALEGLGTFAILALDPGVVNPLAILVLRVVLGAFMIVHSAPKLKDLKGPAGWIRGTGWSWGAAFVLPFTLLEALGGLAVLVGFLTRPVAILFVLEMVATTIFSKQKLGKKFVGGYELDLLYLGIALALLFLGPGGWSVDAALGL